MENARRQKVNLRLEDGQIPAGVSDVIPCVIDLPLWLHLGQHGSRPRGIMAIGTVLNAREVDTRVASLTVDVAREIPVQVSTVPGDRGI